MYWRRFSYIFIVVILMSAAVLPQLVRAADTSKEAFLGGLYYNNLISDSDFIATDSMSTGDIQAFLEGKGSALANAPADRLGTGNEGRSAAKIIYDAAHGYREASGTSKGITVANNTVSPRVLLATLQKEQSLITLTSLDDNRLRIAMGYGCPDSGGCDDRYYGFTNQVEWAAWQLRYNYEIAGQSTSWWNSNYSGSTQYRTGNTVSMGDGTGVYSVTFNNKATAALYRYTPHVFNGNYNFWKLMISYFDVSSTQGSGGEATNDTTSVSTKTYRSKYSVSGTKASDVSVIIGGNTIASSGSTSWTNELEPSLGVATYTVTYVNSGGSTVATKTIEIDRRKPGDVNGDGKVELLDASLMSDAWGQNVEDDAWLNLNPDIDNVVDLLDLSLLASNFEG